jgi:hypothetical protein
MGELAETIVRAPFMMPEPPIPATARPIIKALDDWADPQTADPTSKMKRKARNVYYTRLMMYTQTRNRGRLYLVAESCVKSTSERLQSAAVRE